MDWTEKIEHKKKIRKIVTYRSDDCVLKKQHEKINGIWVCAYDSSGDGRHENRGSGYV